MTDDTEPKQDGRKTRWLNATPEERKAHGEKVRAGKAAAKLPKAEPELKEAKSEGQ